MAIFLFLCMILIPIAEIAVFIEIGNRIGMWFTIGGIILTAFIGMILLRWQGIATLINVQKSLEQNHFPIKEVFNGICLLFAGALLLTPGFVTDTIGFLLFIPAFRLGLRKIISKYLINSGRIKMYEDVNKEYNKEKLIIEGKFHEISSTDKTLENDKST